MGKTILFRKNYYVELHVECYDDFYAKTYT